jgi:hypothetical protein
MRTIMITRNQCDTKILSAASTQIMIVMNQERSILQFTFVLSSFFLFSDLFSDLLVPPQPQRKPHKEGNYRKG